MNPNPPTPNDTGSEIDELMIPLNSIDDILKAYGVWIADGRGGITFTEAKTAIQAYYDKRIKEAVVATEKAFGGCKKCYGKGYATVIQTTAWSDTDQDIGSPGGSGRHERLIMEFCSCDRGKQLAKLKGQD